MIQVIRKYSLILILIFIFINIYNLEAKILYDKSGIIITDLDLKNYIDLLEKENPNSHLEDNPVSVFDKIDTNHDGRISWDEFSSFVKKNKDNAIRNVFKRIDKGGDGTINSGEFLMLQFSIF